MNIGRAKIALIFAFLGLNLFLVYNLFQTGHQDVPVSDLLPEELQRIEKFVEESNYFPDIPLERAVRTGSFVTVVPHSRRWASLVQEACYISTGEQADTYYCPGKQVLFYPGGRVEIHYLPSLPLHEADAASEEEKLESLVENFIKDNFGFENLKFDQAEKGPSGELALSYVQDLDGLGLFSSYVKVRITGVHDVAAVDWFWLEPLDTVQKRPMKVISAAEAVEKLVEKLGPAEKPCPITRLDLGYYSQEYEAQQWDIPPVWRIIVDYLHTYYINAFTGHLEDSSNIIEEEGILNNSKHMGGD